MSWYRLREFVAFRFRCGPGANVPSCQQIRRVFWRQYYSCVYTFLGIPKNCLDFQELIFWFDFHHFISTNSCMIKIIKSSKNCQYFTFRSFKMKNIAVMIVSITSLILTYLLYPELFKIPGILREELVRILRILSSKT